MKITRQKTNFSIILVTTLILTSAVAPTNHFFAQTTQAEPLSTPLSVDPKISTILSMINETMIRNYLTNLLSYGPRLTSNYGCQQAAKYIHEQFATNGLETRYQNWTGWGNRWHPGIFNSQNVEATLQGISKRTIVFNAHYDTVANTVGADDNGDGVVAVLAAAYVLSHFTFLNTLKFVTFSGEEQGLLGSHTYAKEAYENHDDIVVALNADMIGYATNKVNATQVRTYGTEDVSWILDLAQELNTTYNLGFTFTRGITKESGRGGSDYFSFVEYGYETVAFFEKDWNQAMHTPHDNFENVNISYLVNTTRLIVATMAYLADHEISHPQIKILSPRFGKWYINGRERPNLQDLKTMVIGDILVWTEVKPGTSPIEKVEFYYDDALVFVDTEAPYSWHLNSTSIKNHNVTAVVYDTLGQKAHDWKTIRYIDLGFITKLKTLLNVRS